MRVLNTNASSYLAFVITSLIMILVTMIASPIVVIVESRNINNGLRSNIMSTGFTRHKAMTSSTFADNIFTTNESSSCVDNNTDKTHTTKTTIFNTTATTKLFTITQQ
mmetsp:Transcript_33685/g.36290  ORF Transcript_33685/g.36290 Transcript_33685/m.36290 type:complete len:108 (-) Transcript_33685:335-658(-)